jgi:hypothetical protein
MIQQSHYWIFTKRKSVSEKDMCSTILFKILTIAMIWNQLNVFQQNYGKEKMIHIHIQWRTIWPHCGEKVCHL